MPRSCVTERKWSTPISSIIWNEPGSNDSVAPASCARCAAARAADRGGSVKNDQAVRCRCDDERNDGRGTSLGSR